MSDSIVRDCRHCGKNFNVKPCSPNKRYCSYACHLAYRRSPESIAERFWAKADKNGPVPPHRPELGQCWMWTGHREKRGTGYGHFSPARRSGGGHSIRAHRFSYELTYGEIDDSMCVLHRCDNPPCCNPAHLFLGTHADNASDKVSKGRACRGETHGRRRLSAETVLEIRALYAAGGICHREISERFTVSQGQVSNILSRKSWAHLKP